MNGVLKNFAKYASLNVLGMIGLSCYILADTFFVARSLGADGLAALNIAIPVYSLIHGTGLMLGMGGATRFSLCGDDDERCRSAVTHTALMAAIFSAVYILAGVFFAEDIAYVLGARGNIIPMCKSYMRILMFFSPMFISNNIFICLNRNDGAPKLSMAAMLAGSFSNILMDYVFMFPMGMGMTGAALATGASPIVSMAVMLPRVLAKKNGYHLARLKMKISECGRILLTGAPSLITELSNGIVISVFNLLILRLSGNIGVAAYGITANVSIVAISVFTGVAQGSQPLISRMRGEGRPDDCRRVLRFAMISAVVLSAVIYSCAYFFADEITAIFNSENNAKLALISIRCIKIYFTGCLFAGINIIFSIYFSSFDQPVPANIISMMRGFAVTIPMAFLLSAIGGIDGLWMTFPAAECVTSLAAAGFYIFSRRREKARG